MTSRLTARAWAECAARSAEVTAQLAQEAAQDAAVEVRDVFREPGLRFVVEASDTATRASAATVRAAAVLHQMAKAVEVAAWSVSASATLDREVAVGSAALRESMGSSDPAQVATRAAKVALCAAQCAASALRSALDASVASDANTSKAKDVAAARAGARAAEIERVAAVRMLQRPRDKRDRRRPVV